MILFTTPAKAGVQHRAGRNWTPAFAGVAPKAIAAA